MNTRISRIILGVCLISLLCTSGGCSAQAVTELDGKTVAATAGPLNGVAVTSRDDSAEFSIAGRDVRVTPDKITWAIDSSLTLPAQWKRMELKESGKRIIVLLDGKRFSEI